MITIRPTGDWTKVLGELDPRHVRGALRNAIAEEGEHLRQKVIAAYETAGASNGRSSCSQWHAGGR